MTHVFHRHLRQTPPVAASAQGMFIRDAEGREYLDASGGAAVSSLGHGHHLGMAAMHAQIDTLAYAHTSFFTSEVAERGHGRAARGIEVFAPVGVADEHALRAGAGRAPAGRGWH